jgi:hypothetical protein
MRKVVIDCECMSLTSQTLSSGQVIHDIHGLHANIYDAEKQIQYITRVFRLPVPSHWGRF